MSDHLQISIEADQVARRRQRCNQKVEILKATEFPSSQDSPSQPAILQQELFGKTNSEILQAVQNGNVDSFVDVLEQLCSKKKLPLSAIFDQVTPAGDSLLHEAAYFGKAEIAELIGHHFPKLLTKTNIKGDTPLHVAARSRSAGVMKLILSQYAAQKSTSSRENNKDEEITRMSNEYGNTALHEAVGSKDIEGVTLLFEADKYVTHYLNKSDKSPLYLAILSSSKDIVNILLEAPFPDDKPLPKCHGNSPLHAAIYTKNTDLVKEILEKRPDLMFLRDEYEGTPLHYAAATGYAKGIHLLGNKSTLTALEWNSKGQLPIHLACKFGHIEVLKEFLQQEWADPRILLNKEGQNILHVAAKNSRENVVQHLLKNTKFKQLSINEKDINGNTPLHLAAKNLHRSILFSLTEEKIIDVNLMNNEGLTARDILLNNTPMTYKQMLSNAILISAGAQMSGKAKGKLSKSEDKITAREEGLKNRINTLMVVATLILTVTFTAGFTIPGGLYSSDDPNPRKRGMPVFANRTDFRFFILFDIVAMCSSTVAATMLMAAQLVGAVDLGLKLLSIASYLVILALQTMMGAFMCAVYLVVSDVSCLKLFDDYVLNMSSYLIFFILPMYVLCWAVLGRFTLSVYWVLLVFRRASGLFRIRVYNFGYVSNY